MNQPKNPPTYHKPKVLFSVMILLLIAVGANINTNINNQSRTDDLGQPFDISNQIKTPELDFKTFKSPQLGLQFTYPKDWQVKQSYNQSGLDWLPNLKAVAPGGTAINITTSTNNAPGSSCQQNIYDKPHNTLDCNTIEVLSRQKTELVSPQGDVYLIRAMYTGPRPAGSSVPSVSSYLVFLSSDPKLANSTGPMVGNWSPVGLVATPKGYITVDISGVDKSHQASLSSLRIKQAEEILTSIKNY